MPGMLGKREVMAAGVYRRWRYAPDRAWTEPVYGASAYCCRVAKPAVQSLSVADSLGAAELLPIGQLANRLGLHTVWSSCAGGFFKEK